MESVLDVRSLCKQYPGFALDHVSFSVAPGCVMGLIGPNGAGKTTILKSILGLVQCDSGEIRIFDLDASRHGPEVRARISFVHQEPSFYHHLSLERNAAAVGRFCRSWDAEAFRRLAGVFGLPLGKRFGVLSRGTKTKFALALALARQAELIIMDEPTSGLDPVFRRDLLDILADPIPGERRSILFSTHITSDLERIADYVTLLQDGRILFSAEKDEILHMWGLVKGGPDLLSDISPDYFRGIRRGAHGFEALTDDAAAVRRRLGESVVIEKPSLDDIVLYTTNGEVSGEDIPLGDTDD